jgi:hypothetical protein
VKILICLLLTIQRLAWQMMMATMDMDKSGDNPPSLIQSALSGISLSS